MERKDIYNELIVMLPHNLGQSFRAKEYSKIINLSFEEMGLTSISMIEFLVKIEEKYGFELDDNTIALGNKITVKELIDEIEDLL